jgi:hypothetical protein
LGTRYSISKGLVDHRLFRKLTLHEHSIDFYIRTQGIGGFPNTHPYTEESEVLIIHINREESHPATPVARKQ